MTSKLDLEPTFEEIGQFLIDEYGYDEDDAMFIMSNWWANPEYTDIACVAEQKLKQKKMEAAQKTD